MHSRGGGMVSTDEGYLHFARIFANWAFPAILVLQQYSVEHKYA
jgi:hypothetical protein